MSARIWRILLVLAAAVAAAASSGSVEPKGKEWAEQARNKWLKDVRRVSLHFVVDCGLSSVREQVETQLRLKAMTELRRCGIAIVPAGMPEDKSILPVLRISLIMTHDPARGRRYYYCVAAIEHIEPCSLFRTKEIGMANCWNSGPVLIGGQVKDIVERIDWYVRQYTTAVTQAGARAEGPSR